MKKSYLVTIGLVLMIVISSAFTKDEPQYKNLKVLPKNTTKQQMDSVMKHFTVALGVKCNFCHVYNQEQKSMDFASDANKHKPIAREMMKMTSKINDKYFDVKRAERLDADLEVTCYTCHNGKAHPAKFAPAPKPQQAAGDSTRRQ
jgi:hypothetical protein